MTSPESRLRFIVVGRAGMDLYPEPAGTKIAEAAQFSAMLGGSAANIAAGLARLGAQVDLMTALSDDPVGRFCAARLDAFGIGQRLISRSGPETRTSLALSETLMDQHETVIYRNGAADFDLGADLPDRMDLTGLAALVVTGTALAREPSRMVTLRAIALAQEAEVPVVLDLDYRPYSWASAEEASEIYTAAAQHSSIVVGNDLEFAVLRGASSPTADHARTLCREGPGACIYKMGQDGAITFHAGQEQASGIFPVRALKPVGAGDAFLASFLVTRFAGSRMDEAVRRGSAAAALVVSRPGCSEAMPRAEDVTAFMQANRMTIPTVIEA